MEVVLERNKSVVSTELCDGCVQYRHCLAPEPYLGLCKYGDEFEVWVSLLLTTRSHALQCILGPLQGQQEKRTVG
ncbi:hypothetical protein D9M69_635190 [compost metagenome]